MKYEVLNKYGEVVASNLTLGEARVMAARMAQKDVAASIERMPSYGTNPYTGDDYAYHVERSFYLGKF